MINETAETRIGRKKGDCNGIYYSMPVLRGDCFI